MTTSITKDHLLQRNDKDYISAELDGEMILLHLESADYFGMDKTTTQIWKLLEQPKDITALVTELTNRYVVEKEECEADIRPVLENMVERAFLLLPKRMKSSKQVRIARITSKRRHLKIWQPPSPPNVIPVWGRNDVAEMIHLDFPTDRVFSDGWIRWHVCNGKGIIWILIFKEVRSQTK